MKIFPAIDLIDGKAVRLYKGDYDKKTVFNDNPVNVAMSFKDNGAEYIHIVDLDGAKSGNTPNFELVKNIKNNSGLYCEIGGGIRDNDCIAKYLDNGIDRVILGTIAVTNLDFVSAAVSRYGNKIAVGADIRDGYISIKGWTEQSSITTDSFFKNMLDIGVDCIICTDISRDGAMKGTNVELYSYLKSKYPINITASGGVSTITDVKRLKEIDLYGAIIGKAWYTGAINLTDAIKVAK